MLAHEPFLARARAENERGHDEGARVALAAYALARLIDHLARDGSLHAGDPASDIAPGFLEARDDAAAWSTLRRRLDSLPQGEAEVAHLRGIVAALGERENGRRVAAFRASLLAYAYFLEHEGRLDEGLDFLTLTARTWSGEIPPAEYGQLALYIARLNRLLARWAPATNAYRAAEQAGQACGDMVVVLRGRLGQGAVLRGQGNLPMARDIAQAVVAQATTPELQHIQAGAYADLGAVYLLMDRRVDALVANYEAFLRTTDPVQRMRVLGDLGIGLAEIGAGDVARLAFGIVRQTSTSALLRMNARLELMALDAADGNRVAFEQHRQAAREFEPRMPPSMRVDYRYKAGVGLARFGQQSRARALWSEGCRIAEEHQLNEWYFRLERALGASEPVPPPAPVPTPATTDDYAASAIARMATGLQAFAAGTPAAV